MTGNLNLLWLIISYLFVNIFPPKQEKQSTILDSIEGNFKMIQFVFFCKSFSWKFITLLIIQ